MTRFGHGNSELTVAAFWSRIVDDVNISSPELCQLFLQSNLTVLGEKCRPVCVGMTWRRLLAAWTRRQWRPRLEETNAERESLGPDACYDRGSIFRLKRFLNDGAP